ncbi:hypothetical protein [Hypnocyclicus thermotrophus]|nr:hypothetical protein [Hypnocyclicus thermotrophus]
MFFILNARITRETYIYKLNEYFKSFNINNGKYNKNQKNIYEILMIYGDQ